MKKIFKDRSKLLFFIASLESIFSIYLLFSFNYQDREMYSKTSDLLLLVQNMYTSTWWALILLIFALISIFSLIAFFYKDKKFQVISIMLYIILIILAVNVNDTFMNNLSALAIFIPLFIINIISYFKAEKR